MGISIFEKADGEIAFFGTFTNNILDKHGDILSRSAHEDFVARWDAGEVERIPLYFWHIPVEIGYAVMFAVDEETGFVYVAGYFEKAYRRLAKDLAASGVKLGMSHAVMPEELFFDPFEGTIEKYTPYELSVLPAERAANPFTVFSIEGGTMKQLSDAKAAQMAGIIGQDNLDQLLAKAGERAEVAEAMNLPRKDEDGEAMADHATAAEEAVEDQVAEEVAGVEESEEAVSEETVEETVEVEQVPDLIGGMDASALGAVVGEIIKESLVPLNPILESLANRVAALEEGLRKEAEEGAKRAEELKKEAYADGLRSSLASVIGASNLFAAVASNASATVLSKDDELSAAAPQEGGREVDGTVQGVFNNLLGIN